jgi:hypothetical protein
MTKLNKISGVIMVSEGIKKMTIEMTQESEQYIKENGSSITVLLGSLTGCCSGAVPIPQINLGVPKNLSLYKKNIIGDITVFVDIRIGTEKKIQISLAKLLWFKRLSVDMVK